MLAGLKGGQEIPLRTDLIINRALTVIGAFGVDARAYAEAIGSSSPRRFPLEKLHTHTFGLDDTALAIETLAGEVAGEAAVHVSVHPGAPLIQRGATVLIDAHAHLLPRDYPADAPECFPRMEPIDGETARLLVFGPLRFKASDVFFDAERRIEAMDASGVDAEVLSPDAAAAALRPAGRRRAGPRPPRQRVRAPPCARPRRLGSFALGHGADAGPGRRDRRAHGDRGTWGSHGVEIASNVLGSSIGDEQFLPFFQEAERLGVPVFVHAMPSPDRPPAGGGDGHLRRRHRGRLRRGIHGARRHRGRMSRSADLVQPRGRGLPADAARARSYFWGGSWNEEPKDPERAVLPDDGPSPLEYARRFYYDSMVFDRRAIRYLIDLLGADRLLVGSDFPAMLREEPAARPCGRWICPTTSGRTSRGQRVPVARPPHRRRGRPRSFVRRKRHGSPLRRRQDFPSSPFARDCAVTESSAANPVLTPREHHMNSSQRRDRSVARMVGSFAVILSLGLSTIACAAGGGGGDDDATGGGDGEAQSGGSVTTLLDAGFSGGWNTGLDPATSNTVGANLPKNSAIFGGLFTLEADEDGGNAGIVDNQAESHEWSDDDLTLTIKLREGITFSDGTPLNAEAVVWNWIRALNSGSTGTPRPAQPGAARPGAQPGVPRQPVRGAASGCRPQPRAAAPRHHSRRSTTSPCRSRSQRRTGPS